MVFNAKRQKTHMIAFNTYLFWFFETGLLCVAPGCPVDSSLGHSHRYCEEGACTALTSQDKLMRWFSLSIILQVLGTKARLSGLATVPLPAEPPHRLAFPSFYLNIHFLHKYVNTHPPNPETLPK